MRTAIAADWAYGSSAVHRRDPRVKLMALVALLLAITTAGRRDWVVPSVYTAVLLLAAPICGVPPRSLLVRAVMISLFAAPFAVLLSFTEGGEPGIALWLRAFACALAVLLLAGTTRLPDLMRALRWLRTPRLLVEVIQFVYRYVFVIGDHAHRMRTAAAARGGVSFRAAGGLLAVLFARSYQRAENIHRAMLSRGYVGALPHVQPAAAGPADAVFLACICLGAAALRLAADYIQ